jgi:thioredoxin reductase (NADPH)
MSVTEANTVSAAEETAFPQLTPGEIAVIKPLATLHDYEDGDFLFQAGQAEIDFYVIESGKVEILNPADGNRVIVTHEPGQFSGDIDLLTGRPVIVTAVARGATRVWRVPGSQLRSLLNRVPSLGEKLIVAFTRRRELLARTRRLGLCVLGPATCRQTNVVREFLYKNFVPFTWFDSESDEGRRIREELGSPAKMPAVRCSNGDVLENPTTMELAQRAGIWKCAPEQEVDIAIIGAGPAGLAAAVYASSEGLSTLMLDRMGPGGQVAGSSRIENFIGFPAGLSGADLAMRGALQLLKFGAQIVAPVSVDRLTPANDARGLHTLHLNCGAQIRSHVVLVATGVHWRKLEADGAERFTGAGVFYACTTVEADLYDDRDVAVVGAGNSAGQAMVFLAECCPTRTVHAIVRRRLGPGMSAYLATRIRGLPNVVIHEQTEIDALRGGSLLEEISLKNAGGAPPGRLPCAAVFVFIGADPSAEWLPPGIARDDKGYLLTGTDVVRSGLWPCADRDPCPLETTIPGVLAAGDIRAGSTKRVGFAVGDGSLAVTCAHRLISIRT